MKSFLTGAVLIFLYILLSSNDLWLQPEKFIYKRGELINIRFLAGENFNGENWSGNVGRVENLSFYFGNVSDKKLKNALTAEEGDSLQFVMLDEGTAMVAFESKNSFIEQDDENFNNYLRAYSLTDALKYRDQHNQSTRPGKEYYKRSVKTIFQVGGKTDNTYKHKTGLPIDIIPDDHPYLLAKDDNFKVKILFRGSPMKNAKVNVWHKLKDRVTLAEYKTDDDGNVKFFTTPAGQWMVSTVKMVHIDNDPKAEWQSYWGSLTWGYE